MAKYIKKPVTIEALQWTGKNLEAVLAFCPSFERTVTEDVVQTLEGAMRATAGDFIIKGIKGEFYPCKPDIFEATYYTEQEYAEATS